MIILNLPYPPTVNHMYGARRTGGKFLNAPGRAFKAAVAEIVAAAGHTVINGRVSMSVVARMPDRRKRDLDNLLKITQDALTDAGVWIDDSQIDALMIERGTVTKGGEIVVRVCEVMA